MNNDNIDKDKAAEFEKDMEWKAKLFHGFDGRTIDLKTFGIVAKLDQLNNHCWLLLAYLIVDRLKTLVGSHIFERYLRFWFLKFRLRKFCSYLL